MTPFLHNWASEVEVESAFSTLVDMAEETLAEERNGLVGRPTRTMRFVWTGINRAEAQQMILELGLAGAAGLELPLYCDVAETTASSSGTTINCPTADRRFAVGKRVVIFELEAGRPTNAQTPTVTVIGASSLTLSGALTGSYAAGALVFPLIETLPVLEPQLQFLTDDVVDLELVVTEPLEDSLLSLEVIGEDPTGFDLHEQWPIFDLEPEWSDGVLLGLTTEAMTYSQGRSVCVETRGPRPRVTIDAGYLQVTRAEAFALLRFFESRGGRLSPFWLACPSALWTPTALATTHVDVEEAGTASVAEDLFTHVGVVMNDGTVYVRAISAIVDSGTTWRIGFSSVLPALDLDDVRRITPAFFVRFARDSLVERWVTDEVCQIPFSAIEVLGEATVTL